VRAKNYYTTTAAADVTLEELCLAPDGTNVLGKVRVRNLAYFKLITVRFTFDSWESTSEVTGTYAESPSPEFDLFLFTIRLNDLLARNEDRTLVLAVRYVVDGREMWDNNGGQNYVATFSKVKINGRREPVPAHPDIPSLRNRYDFAASLRTSWNPSLPANNRTQCNRSRLLPNK
jgi:hypothetical protein